MVNAEEFKSVATTINSKDVATDSIYKASLIIIGAATEELQNKKKLSVAFEGIEKHLILNQTNLKVMIETFGRDTLQWAGKKVKLVTIPSSYQGQPTKSILIMPQA